MTTLLEDIINVLPQGQQLALKALLSSMRKSGFLQSPREQEIEARRLAGLISKGLGSKLLEPQFAVPGEKISSEAINTNMKQVYMDLSALYAQAALLGNADQYQTASLQSDFLKSRAAVQKLLTDVRVHALRKKYPEFNEVKVLDFNSSQNQSTVSPTAVVSEKVRLLQLRPVVQNRIQLPNRGLKTTQIYTNTIGNGLRGSLAKSFSPENMVDQKPETFWGTIVLADAPISQRYESTSRSGGVSVHDVRGPISEIYFRFSHTEKLNTIRLLPFSEYPIRILDVSYRGAASSQVFVGIDDFEETTTLDWMELNFDAVYAHEVRVTVCQENAKQLVYHLPKSAVIGTDLLQEILDLRTANLVGQLGDAASLQFAQDEKAYSRALQVLDELLNTQSLDLGAQTDIEYYDNLLELISQSLEDLDQESAKQVTSAFMSKADRTVDPILEVRKYEYLIGMREAELLYTSYSPVGHYASEKFDTKASLSEVQLEVDERHVEYTTPWQADFRHTSTEWSIDIGEGRVVPIHPRNQVDTVDGIPAAKEELLDFDRSSAVAYTRHGGLYESVYRLKQDGELLPITGYTVERQTAKIPVLKIALASGQFNENSTYTADYAVSPDSYAIQALDLFASRPVSSPELFTGMGPNHDVVLGRTPFIDYGVINRDTLFVKDSRNAKWVFQTPQDNYGTGQMQIFPTIVDELGDILVTGSITGYSLTGQYGAHSGEPPINFSTYTGSASYFNDPYGYFMQVCDLRSPYQVSGWAGSGAFTFFEPPVLTTAQIYRLPDGAFVGDLTGASKSGYVVTDYLLGVGIQSDDQVYALGQTTYEPLRVSIGGREALNITDYEALQHPAFSIGTNRDGEYEYIQAGKRLYFNQDVVGQSIQVEYRWVNAYIQLLGTLRCHKAIAPDVSPKVNEARLLLQNLTL